jgi:hypothetical protein
MGYRDTRVYNYARHMMYEIWDGSGPMRFYYCKETKSVLDGSKVPELLKEYENISGTVCDGPSCRISPIK